MNRKTLFPALLFLLAIPAVAHNQEDSHLYLTTSPSFLYRTNHAELDTTQYEADIFAFYDYENVSPLVNFGFNIHYNYIHAFFDFPVRPSYVAFSEYPWAVNAPWRGIDLDTTFNFKGGVSVSNSFSGLTLARNKLDFGPGHWSSAGFNKQVPYWDYINAWFSYKGFTASQYLITLDPVLSNADEKAITDGTYTVNGEPVTDYNENDQGYNDRAKTVIIHELAYQPFDVLTFRLGELNLLGGKNLEVKNLNPFIVYHSYYGENYMNMAMFVSVEWDYVPSATCYIDGSIDDLVSPIEAEVSYAPPPAFSILAGNDYTFNVEDISLRFITEAAYVSATYGQKVKPYKTMYSRHTYIDFTTSSGYRNYVDYPLGYYMGVDLIDFHNRIEYKEDDFTAGLDYQFSILGERNIHSEHPFSAADDSQIGWFPTGIPEYRHEVSFDCSYFPNKTISVTTAGFVLLSFNDTHEPDITQFDWGVSLSVSKSFKGKW